MNLLNKDFQFIRLVILLCFFISTVFDPADRILGLKLELFLLYALTLFLTRYRSLALNIEIIFIVSIFLFIPLASILIFYFNGGGYPFAGFQMFLGYGFITLSILLFNEPKSFLQNYCRIISAMSIFIIFIAIIINVFPTSFFIINSFGYQYGVISLDSRSFSEIVTLQQIYFVTSPLCLLALTYYLSRYLSLTSERGVNFFLFMINFTGMMLTGNRSNILVAILCSGFIFYYVSRNKIILSFIYLIIFTLLAFFIFDDVLLSFFDPDEFSNSIKIGLLATYKNMFNNLFELFFGQGLGAYIFWESKGYTTFTSELTFLEIFRFFGLIGGSVILAAVLFPVYRLMLSQEKQKEILGIGLLFYIILSSTNPNFFNSMGISVYSLLLVESYRKSFAITKST